MLRGARVARTCVWLRPVTADHNSMDICLNAAYDRLMDTMSADFHVTEAGMRAVLETMTTMNHAITILSRRLDEMNGEMVVLAAQLELLSAACDQSGV